MSLSGSEYKQTAKGQNRPLGYPEQVFYMYRHYIHNYDSLYMYGYEDNEFSHWKNHTFNTPSTDELSI